MFEDIAKYLRAYITEPFKYKAQLKSLENLKNYEDKLLGLNANINNKNISDLRDEISELEITIVNQKKEFEDKLDELIEYINKEINSIEIFSYPENYVLYPTLQALAYSVDNELLKKLYVNLLVSSMDNSLKDKIHPGFVEIIKNLSPLDAKNLSLFNMRKNMGILPTSDIEFITFGLKTPPMTSYSTIFLESVSNEELKNKSSLKLNSSSISNLQRLGLISKINFPLANDLLYEKHYKIVEFLNMQRTSKVVGSNREDISISKLVSNKFNCELKKSHLKLTSYGEYFKEAVSL